MANRLMEIVANHGTGNDILALAKLIKSADPNANVPHAPLMQISHESGRNVYDCIGFTPPVVFKKLANIADEGKLPTQAMERILQDQELVEQMACLMFLVSQSLPNFVLAHALGGSPDK